MEKLTLSYVGRFTTKKDGTPLLTKAGKPYTSLRIKCNEYGDKYLSGFDSIATKDWKEGMTVEVEVEQKGEYLNFSVPRKDDIRLVELENKHTKLELRFNKLMGILVEKGILPKAEHTVPGTTVKYPDTNTGTAFDDPEEGGFRPEDIAFD